MSANLLELQEMLRNLDMGSVQRVAAGQSGKAAQLLGMDEIKRRGEQMQEAKANQAEQQMQQPPMVDQYLAMSQQAMGQPVAPPPMMPAPAQQGIGSMMPQQPSPRMPAPQMAAAPPPPQMNPMAPAQPPQQMPPRMFSGGGSVMKFQDGGDVLNRFASLSDEELRKAFEDAGRMRAPQGLLGKIMPSYSVPTGEGLEIQRLIQEEIERRIASRGLEGREMYGLRASVLQGRDPEISDKEIKMIEGAQETQDAIRKAFTLPTPVRFQDKPKPVEYSSIFIDRPELFAAPPGAEIAPESPATTAENGLTPGSPEVKPSEEEPGILDRFGKTVKSGKLQPLFDMMMRSGLGLAAGENIGEAGIAGLTQATDLAQQRRETARAEAADELRARLGESEIELSEDTSRRCWILDSFGRREAEEI
jgi:hypothetical protein